MAAWSRVENAACARRLSAIADMFEARLALDGSAERDQWCVDNWDLVAAEVAAAHAVSLGVASHQLMMAMALRERLPRVAEVFHTGAIGLRLVQAIVYRTALIADPQARAKVDVELAAVVSGWGAMSVTKAEESIDYWVERYDRYALRRMDHRARGRHVDEPITDGSGTATIEAVLLEHDAATLDQRLELMARAVCDGDGRTAGSTSRRRVGRAGRRRRQAGLHLRTRRLPSGGNPGQCGGDQCDRRREKSVGRHPGGPGRRAPRRQGRPHRHRHPRHPPTRRGPLPRSCWAEPSFPRRCWRPKSPPGPPSDGYTIPATPHPNTATGPHQRWPGSCAAAT